MGWDYDWQAGPLGGSLTALDLYCDFIRLPKEPSAGYRGRDPVVQYRHGVYPVRKWAAPLLLMLEVGVRYTNSAGAVTHVDGAAGHVFENLAAVRKLLAGDAGGQATIQRTAPDQGDVQLDVQVLAAPTSTQQQHVYGFMLHAAHPFWRETTQQSTTSTTSLTVGGNAPVGDMTFDVVGGTDPTVNHTASGAAVGIEGANPAGGVTIDVGAGTATRISGGADYSAFLSVNRPYWMEFEPDKANAITVTGAPTSVTTKSFDQWR